MKQNDQNCNSYSSDEVGESQVLPLEPTMFTLVGGGEEGAGVIDIPK